MLQVCRQLYKEGGVRRFFKAPLVLSLTVFTEKFCFFFWYVVTVSMWVYSRGIKLSGVGVAPQIICGWAAENLAIPTRFPFEVVLRDMQTSVKKEGAPAVIVRIWKSQGILGFYKGWSAILLFGFRSGIMQSIFDQLKVAWLRRLQRPAGSEVAFITAFLLGAFSRFIATFATFPLLRAKIMAMSEKGSHLGVLGSLHAIWQQDGFLALYQGLWAEMLRSIAFQVTIPSYTIVLTCRDNVLQPARAGSVRCRPAQLPVLSLRPPLSHSSPTSE